MKTQGELREWERDVIERGWSDTIPLTALEGIGGDMGTRDEDFEVSELPAYEPCGHGEHLYLRIEKRGRTTMDVAKILEKSFGVQEIDVGCAGKKDAHAVTRQWFSVHTGSDGTEPLSRLSDHGWMRVLDVTRHTNKLRMGHLRGNAFRVRIYGSTASDDTLTRACGAMQATGFLNYFGKQRFGFDGGNVSEGIRVMNGARARHQMKKLYISAVQSAIFNLSAARRFETLGLGVVTGDIMQKLQAGCFVCDDPETDAERVLRGEIAATLSLPGKKIMRAQCGADWLETDAARDFFAFWNKRCSGLSEEMGEETLSRFANGDRRIFAVRPEHLNIERGDAASLEIRFELPPGAYATVLLRHLCGSSFTR